MKISDIIREVSAYYSIDEAMILSHRRAAEYVKPRHMAMLIACEQTTKSLPQIGSVFNRDHTSIMHARKRMGKQLSDNPRLNADYQAIMAQLATQQKRKLSLVKKTMDFSPDDLTGRIRA